MGQADRTIALLSGLAAEERALEQMLGPGRVAVILGPDLAATPQGQALVSFMVNLLGRLFPVMQNLHVVVPEDIPLVAHAPRWQAATLEGHLRRFLEALRPRVQWAVAPRLSVQPNFALVIGAAMPPCEHTVYVGSDGWEATLSPSEPVPVGVNVNPVGAYAAACLGVAEAWKRLLLAHSHLLQGLPVIPLDAPLTLSTFTYLASGGQVNPSLPSPLDLGRTSIVGLGAGGSAAAYTLASLRQLQGTITQIEPDDVIDSNLNRYVMADADDAARGRPKTDVVEALFQGCQGVALRTFSVSYEDAAGSLAVEDYRHVVAAVHSREARRSIQYETPMVLWDAGATEQGDFYVWRHILGVTNCMWCKYPPGDEDPEHQKAEQLARQVGLDAETWLRKGRSNEVFTAQEVAALALRTPSPGTPFDLPVPGQRYGDWEAAQCGRLRLPEIEDEVPVPFAPVMAGILLAGEVVKQHHFPEAVLDSYYWNTLMGRFMRANRPHRRLPNLDCRLCGDPEYLAQYRRRWS